MALNGGEEQLAVTGVDRSDRAVTFYLRTSPEPPVSMKRHLFVLFGGMAASLLVGCTNADAIGPPPTFISLVEVGVPPAPSLLRRIPKDSCPKFAPTTVPVRRMLVPGGGGVSIGVPSAVALQEANFGRDPGAVYRVPGDGLLMVSFDTKLPIRSIRSTSQFVGLDDVAISAFFRRWCDVTVNGATAFLYLDVTSSTFIGPNGPQTFVYFTPDMTLSLKNASGRQIFVSIATQSGNSFTEQRDGIERLLSYAATVQ
jgi:hypothetical protein